MKRDRTIPCALLTPLEVKLTRFCMRECKIPSGHSFVYSFFLSLTERLSHSRQQPGCLLCLPVPAPPPVPLIQHKPLIVVGCRASRLAVTAENRYTQSPAASYRRATSAAPSSLSPSSSADRDILWGVSLALLFVLETPGSFLSAQFLRGHRCHRPAAAADTRGPFVLHWKKPWPVLYGDEMR